MIYQFRRTGEAIQRPWTDASAQTEEPPGLNRSVTHGQERPKAIAEMTSFMFVHPFLFDH